MHHQRMTRLHQAPRHDTTNIPKADETKLHDIPHYRCAGLAWPAYLFDGRLRPDALSVKGLFQPVQGSFLEAVTQAR
jgi:hypothetical protein